MGSFRPICYEGCYAAHEPQSSGYKITRFSPENGVGASMLLWSYILFIMANDIPGCNLAFIMTAFRKIRRSLPRDLLNLELPGIRVSPHKLLKATAVARRSPGR